MDNMTNNMKDNMRRISIIQIKKKIIAFIIILVAVVNISVPFDSHAETVVKIRDWKKYKSTYFYNTLNEEGKAIYDEIERDCIAFITNETEAFYSERNYLGFGKGYYYIGGVEAPRNMSMYDVVDIMRQFVYDNPQYYFLEDTYVKIDGASNGLYPKFYMALCVNKKFRNEEYRAEITNQFFDKIEEWESEVAAAGPDEYSMEMKANEIVCDNIEYVSGEYDQLAYSAVIEQATVCTGYAKTMSMLLNANDIPAMVVISKTHAWNKVCLGGNWYMFDATWNDGWNNAIANKPYADLISNIYSNVSTETMHKLDHSKAHDVDKPSAHPVCVLDYDNGNNSGYYVEIDDDTITVYKTDDPNFKNIFYLHGVIPDATKPINTDDQKTDNSNITNTSNADNSKTSGQNNTSSGSTNGNNGNSTQSNQTKYSNEWVDGKWYNADGTQTYKGSLVWASNDTGWWVEDTSGWYPVSTWQKIDGNWYYFGSDGYMASNEWRDGCWLSSNGAWTYEGIASWAGNSTGWWFEGSSGWYATSCWQKIDGYWYYFGSDGYMVSNCYIDGWWISSDGVCY